MKVVAISTLARRDGHLAKHIRSSMCRFAFIISTTLSPILYPAFSVPKLRTTTLTARRRPSATRTLFVYLHGVAPSCRHPRCVRLSEPGNGVPALHGLTDRSIRPGVGILDGRSEADCAVRAPVLEGVAETSHLGESGIVRRSNSGGIWGVGTPFLRLFSNV